MDTRVKKKTSLLAAIVAFVALAVIGSVCFASSAFAVSKGKECSATAEITATFDESGTITVPSTELKNETDYVVTLKSATIASDLKFVADWTNDGANKTIQPGETLTINWTAPSKVSSDWNETGKVHVGTITYHFSYESGSGYITVDDKKVEETQVGKSLVANVDIPDYVDRNKLHYKWIAIDENGNKTVVSEGTGKDYAKYAPKDEDAGKTITFEVTDTSGTYEGTIHSENAVKIYLGKGYITVDNKKVEEAQVGKTLDANIEGIPDSVDRNKLYYKWIAIDENGNKTVVSEGTGKDYASYVTQDSDISKFITFEVTDTSGIYDGPIPSENKVKVSEMIVFAVYSAEDSSLDFYRRSKSEMPNEGDRFNNKIATSVYTGITTDIYKWYPDSTTGLLRSDNPWKEHKNDIKTSSIIDEGIKPISTAHWFGCLEKLESIDGLDKLDTSNVSKMHAMFFDCPQLTSFDVSKFNTSNVTSMNYMFEGCTNIASIDVTKWDTSKVTNMERMFCECNNLSGLDVSNFKTLNVTSMKMMFFNDCKLTKLDLISWNTSKVTNMEGMFYCNYNYGGSYDSSLTELKVSDWDVSNVVNMNKMFGGCSKLTELDLSTWNTKNVIDMQSMFEWCVNLTSLKVSSFNTSKVDNMASMFKDCEKLTQLDLSSFDTSAVDPNSRGHGSEFIPSGGGMHHLLTGSCNLKELTLGKNWKWVSSGGQNGHPDEPKERYIDGADGYWYTVDGLSAYQDYGANKNPIPDGAGTYYAAKKLVPGKTLTGSVDITGTCEVGQTLTATPSGYPAAAILQYQWYRGEGGSKTAIQGANTNEYIVTSDDSGQVITVEVTATNYAAGVLSDSVTIKDAGELTGTVDIQVDGKAVTEASLNATLTANVSGAQTDATGFTYVWYVEGTDAPIYTSSDPTFKPEDSSYVSKKIFVKVTATNHTGSLANSGVSIQEPTTVFAVYSDDGSLKFCKRASVPSVGDTFDGSKVVAVYDSSVFMDGVDVTESKYSKLLEYRTKSVTVVDYGIKPNSMENWFNNYETDEHRFGYDLTSIDLSRIGESKDNTGFSGSTANMFFNCWGLRKIILGNTTIYSKDMNQMFYKCSGLEALDLKHIQPIASITTNFSATFYECSSLKSLDFSSWGVSSGASFEIRPEYMTSMFANCYSLESLNLSCFNTVNMNEYKDPSMYRLLDHCSHLKEITLGNNWVWLNNMYVLVSPSSDFIDGADGNWYYLDNETIKKGIPDRRAGTYYAAKKLLPGRTLTGSVDITGTCEVGQTLTATVSGHPSDATLEYRWYSGAGSSKKLVQDASVSEPSKYTVTADDAERVITVEVTATDYAGTLSNSVSIAKVTNQLTTAASVQADSKAIGKAATKDEVTTKAGATTEAEEAAETEATTTTDAQSTSSTDGTTNASDEASTDAHASSDLPSAVKEESSQDEAQQADNAKTVDKAA